MPYRIPQSVAIRVPLKAFLSSDHITPATGKTIVITISKNGAAYGNPSGGATNAVEIASGSYYVDLSTTDTGTVGPLFILGTCSGVDPVEVIYQVAAFVDQTGDNFTRIGAAGAGLTALGDTRIANLDATVSSRLAPAGTLATVTNLTNAPSAGDFTAAMKTSLNAATPASVTGAVGSVAGNVGGNVVGSVGSVTGLTASNLDATVSSRLATAGYTAPDNADIVLIKAKTDNLPSDPADASDIASAFSTVNSTLGTIAGYIDTEVSAIKAKTDNLPASPAAVGSAMTLTSAYDPAKTASQAGDAMALTSGERATLATAVWASATRTLSSFGTLVADVATAVWGAATRTLSAFGFTVATDVSSTVTTNLDATISSRLASASYSAPDNVGIAAVKAKTDNLPALPASTGDVTSVPDNLLDVELVETGLTVRQALRLIAAATAGKVSGAATTTVVIRNAVADSANRITATVDSDGNRSAITYSL